MPEPQRRGRTGADAEDRARYPNPHEEDIMAGDRRLSRPDASLPDWEVPDTSYRPIPIVWFTGAMIVQLLVMTTLVFALAGLPGYFTIAGAGVATGAIGAWTWRRGMARAAAGWRIATILMLVAQLSLVLLAVADRM